MSGVLVVMETVSNGAALHRMSLEALAETGVRIGRYGGEYFIRTCCAWSSIVIRNQRVERLALHLGDQINGPWRRSGSAQDCPNRHTGNIFG